MMALGLGVFFNRWHYRLELVFPVLIVVSRPLCPGAKTAIVGYSMMRDGRRRGARFSSYCKQKCREPEKGGHLARTVAIVPAS
jgi:hypothetical protein